MTTAKTENNAACPAFRTSIGGQALIEGILMQGPKKRAIVVRGQDGLVVKEEEIKFIKDRYPILGWPLIRGCVNFISQMASGVRALMFSASQLPEEEQEAEQSKLDKWIEAHFSSEKAEKLSGFLISLCGCNKNDVHSSYFVYLIVLDLREDDLLFDTKCIVSSAIERIRVNTTEISYSWKCEVYKSVKEIVHLVTTKCGLASDSHSLTDLEVCDRILCSGDDCVLTCDSFHISNCRIEEFLILFCFADTHVYDNLYELWNFHRVLVAELVSHGFSDLIVILFF